MLRGLTDGVLRLHTSSRDPVAPPHTHKFQYLDQCSAALKLWSIASRDSAPMVVVEIRVAMGVVREGWADKGGGSKRRSAWSRAPPNQRETRAPHNQLTRCLSPALASAASWSLSRIVSALCYPERLDRASGILIFLLGVTRRFTPHSRTTGARKTGHPQNVSSVGPCRVHSDNWTLR